VASEVGFGKKLTRIFRKNSIFGSIYGFIYSSVVTIAPMFLVIVDILLMGYVLGYSKLGYASRELFTSTVLYQFIFALMFAAPFNAVLSKYLSDLIYMEKYEEMWSCFHVGFFLQTLLFSVVGIPFCLHEYFVGHVDILYILVSYCGYVALGLIFYNMIYLSILKDYSKISLFYFVGMGIAFVLAYVFVKLLHWEVTFSMLLGLAFGYLTAASLEYAVLKRYFQFQGRDYRMVLREMRKNWKLIAANTFYILGLYTHNFVFWTTDLQKIVVKTFVSADPYDMASFLALLTNLTSSVIFTVRVEMYFHDRYRDYSEAVIGGRGRDIKKAQVRMFRQLAGELVQLVRIQFIISVVTFLAFLVFLPQYGFSGLIMQIYPCLAAAYFAMFVMYAGMIFLYYFNDLNGAVMASLGFFLITLVGSIVATGWHVFYYGMGLMIGSLAGWAFVYFRLRWIERNLDIHIFCKGRLITAVKGKMPSSLVFNRYALARSGKRRK
jgi:uncharacterized membrane protein